MADLTKPFEMDEDDGETRGTVHGRTIQKKTFDPSVYEVDDRFDASPNYDKPRTTLEVVGHLERNPGTEIEAKIICKEKDGRVAYRRMGRKDFLEQFHKWTSRLDFKESLDCFATDGGFNQSSGLFLGQDFVPLLSGPFFKQLYYHDYLRMHALAFQAYHHDPVAKRCINVIKEFTLGRGFSVDFEDQNDQAQWEGFAEANDLDSRFETIVLELLLFGEQFIWWLPNNEINIGYQLPLSQRPKQGIIPRIRQIDPSVLWEIITYPEDIERVLYYQWIAPTQYQIYTGADQGNHVPGLKFIYQQIPASDVMHFKINCVSGEKRGRSVLFPVFGDLKRLRDTINFSVAGMQKAVAWSMDTMIEGSQADIDAYIQAQLQLGTTPPAGSEFVHTDKIKREYLSNSATAHSGHNETFDWVLSKIAMGIGIPINYLGGHQSGGSNRASAVVATEPVTKMFEYYQKVYEKIIRSMAKRLGCNSRMEVTFPELVSQDRSAKLKDLMLTERAGYFSKRRSATMAAKELGANDYDYDTEQEEIVEDGPIDPNLLIPTGAAGGGGATGAGPSASTAPAMPQQSEDPLPGDTKPSALKGEDKRAIHMRYGA